MNTLADRLKIAREKQGMSQSQLADKIGLSQQSVAKIENGRLSNQERSKRLQKL